MTFWEAGYLAVSWLWSPLLVVFYLIALSSIASVWACAEGQLGWFRVLRWSLAVAAWWVWLTYLIWVIFNDVPALTWN